MTIQHTPNFSFPFPQLGDTADVPRDVGALASALDTFLKGLVPIGAMAMWATANAPSGWVLCQGQELDQVGQYAALFAVLGATYNVAGVGVGKFNVPNFQGNVPVGAGTGYALAQKGGSATVTLSTAQIPAHTHVQNAHSHPTAEAGVDGYIVQDDTPQFFDPPTTSGAGTQPRAIAPTTGNTTAVNQNAGGGGSHSNLQPYQVVNYIIKFS